MNSKELIEKYNNIPSLLSDFRFYYNKLLNLKLKEHGLEDIYSSYGGIIFHLLKAKELAMKDLAKRINRDSSTLTVLVRNLEKKGYLVRKKNLKDTRSCIILLTYKALNLEPSFKDISNQLIQFCSKILLKKK